jgi:thioredoxin reductase (NADPH)
VGIEEPATCLDPGCDGMAAELAGCVERLPAVATEARFRGEGVALVLADGTERAFDVVYAAAGSRPASDLAAGLGARCDARGGIVVDEHCRCSVPGLYAAGDVVSGLDQIAVAFGHAAIAATSIHNRESGPAEVSRRRTWLQEARGNVRGSTGLRPGRPTQIEA